MLQESIICFTDFAHVGGLSSKLYRNINIFYNTSHNKDNVEMLFYVDNDDPSIEDYKKRSNIITDLDSEMDNR